VNARWFPARGRRAIVLLPHWNADAIAYVSLCKVLNMLGIAVLRLSMPYHDIRMPAEISRADYAVSANIGRTLDAVRQGVVDIRCCLDWLEQQGYSKLGIVGTSLGSCYAFIAAAHDPRIRVAAFNHASTYVADVVWHGQSTRHIRQGIESQITLETFAAIVAGGESDGIFQAVLALAAEVAHYLCEVRSDFLARTFARCGDGNSSAMGWITKWWCCLAVTTRWARRLTTIWMGGSWLRSCERRLRDSPKASEKPPAPALDEAVECGHGDRSRD
jgi:dienelactone hydrolase